LLKPILRQLEEPDPAWWADLPKITALTLLIAGGPSSQVPQELLTEVARLIPSCQLVTIENSGHHVHQTSPDAYVRAVRGFLYE
jgi:pimeloyl-ACP methyl ester carboxylesterase